MKSLLRTPWTMASSSVRVITRQTSQGEHVGEDSPAGRETVEQLLDLGDKVVDQMLDLMLFAIPKNQPAESNLAPYTYDPRAAGGGAMIPSAHPLAMYPAPPAPQPARPAAQSGRVGQPGPPGAAATASTAAAKTTKTTNTPPQYVEPQHKKPLQIDPSRRGRLDPTRFVVIGEGLAAGMGNFGVEEFFQDLSFPAQLARHMGVEFEQPLMQSPGVGFLDGFNHNAVAAPQVEQSTVLKRYPPQELPGNLAVPQFKVADASQLHPVQPVVNRDDGKQTAANLILGIVGLRRGDRELPTQLAAAVAKKPTFLVIELGYYDVLEAALLGRPEAMTSVKQFVFGYNAIFAATHKTGAQVLAITIPDPIDTAYFSSLEAAARVLRVEPAVLTEGYGLKPGDLITVHGLMEIGYQITKRELGPLSANATLSAAAAGKITEHVRLLNDELSKLAKQNDAVVYDLAGLFSRVKATGISAGSRHIRGDYLGGFFTLNGCYPGPTGQALIANEIIELLNSQYQASFPTVAIGAVLVADPAAEYRPAEGPLWTWAELRAQSTQLKAEDSGDHCTQEHSSRPRRRRVKRYNSATYSQPSDEPLTLPASMEMVLPVNPQLSFLGDGMRMVNCHCEKDVQFGGCGNLLFGGLAMFGTHLRGSIRIKFSPPVGQVTRFEVNLVDGELRGDDGDLAAPNLYRFPLKQNRVAEIPDFVCSGELDLQNGLVNLDTLVFGFLVLNSGLEVLGQLNAALKVPAAIFKNHDPQRPASVWAQFTQRADGRLDLTFHGSAFVPLGPARYPLPFVGPHGGFATIPTSGTTIHPHVHFSTIEEPADAEEESIVDPDLPTNSVLEFTCSSNRTSFGDGFTLNHRELGFAQGRSMLSGRVQIQFGERFGDLIPIWVNLFAPSGLLDQPHYEPISDLFPGTMFPGMIGHNGVLRFPARSYRQNDLALVGDPFDLAIGAVNVHTGEIVGDFLQRGYLIQNVFFALMRVEPEAERDSFGYRGPARFERDETGRLRYQFNGIYSIPFPPGFKFPRPDMTNAFVIGPESRLDPFFQIQGVHEAKPRAVVKSGNLTKLTATSNETFSVRYSISSDPRRGRSQFEYDNHSQRIRFVMHSLSSVNFTNSRAEARTTADYDTVSFTAFGKLIFYGPGAKNPLNVDVPSEIHVATVQISTAPDIPYVSVLIDGGRVSSVNTQPGVLEPPLLPLPSEAESHEIGNDAETRGGSAGPARSRRRAANRRSQGKVGSPGKVE